MKRRTKKVLSLLLAASMVFTMNTIAFGEEIVAEDVAADDVAVETVVEGAADADLADAEVADAELAAIKEYRNGVAYDENHKPVTKVTFNSDGAKKNPVNSVAVIENATNPISWNNLYAASFIETVINGSDKEDDYLNNSKKQHVSENDVDGLPIPNLKGADVDSFEYGSIEVADDVFVLYKYGTDDKDKDYVAGFDGFETKAGDGTDLPTIDYNNDLANLNTAIKTGDDAANSVKRAIVSRIGKLPVTTWDGRKVAWDKDGEYDATKSMTEDLKVQAALVKYENGTVTEFNGVTLSGVKIDAKAIKQASVEYKTTRTKVAAKYHNTATNKDEDVAVYVDEHATMGDLPSFTITLKVKDKDAKKYNKDIKNVLKNTKFYFGIVQEGIEVNDPTGAFTAEYYTANPDNHWVAADDDDKALADCYYDADATPPAYVPSSTYSRKADSYVIPASSNEITNDKGTGIQDKIEVAFEKGKYIAADKPDVDLGVKIAKFSAKNDKAKATITNVVDLYKKGKYTGSAEVGLKVKKDYNFETYSLAGENVFALTFPEGGNYVYADTDPAVTDSDLGAFGYSYAFRPSPKEKSKDFRYGIVANNDQGFVYNAQ